MIKVKSINYQQIKSEQLNKVKIDYAFISTPSIYIINLQNILLKEKQIY